ncbi:MAG: hypothetical protein V9E83_04965 [Baekduia sp.]
MAIIPVNERELRRYRARIADRWEITLLLVGGARVADARGVPPQRERGPEFRVVVVSPSFDGLPWLERVFHAEALWDAAEMGAAATLECFTPVEWERRERDAPAASAFARDALTV